MDVLNTFSAMSPLGLRQWYTLASFPVDMHPLMAVIVPRFSILKIIRRVRGSRTCSLVARSARPFCRTEFLSRRLSLTRSCVPTLLLIPTTRLPPEDSMRALLPELTVSILIERLQRDEFWRLDEVNQVRFQKIQFALSYPFLPVRQDSL